MTRLILAAPFFVAILWTLGSSAQEVSECSLDPAERTRALAEARAFMTEHSARARSASLSLRIRSHGARTERELHRLLAREAACCPSLLFEVLAEADHIDVTISGPADDVMVVAQLLP